MESLKDVRDRVDFLGEMSGDDLPRAVELASASLAEAELIGPCAISEILGARGTTHRKIGEYDAAGKDFDEALKTCDCPECAGRIHRRKTSLALCLGDINGAQEHIDAAIYFFGRCLNHHWQARTLTVYGVVRYAAGDLEDATDSARLAYAKIPWTDPHHRLTALQNLAGYLMEAGELDEAWDLLESAQSQINKVCGTPLRILKRKLRQLHIYLQFNRTEDHRRARKRLRRLLGDMRDAKQAPLDIAVILSDLAILDEDPRLISTTASEVLALNPEGEHIRQRLEALRDAADSRADVLPFARAVRSECPGAPPMPPALKAA